MPIATHAVNRATIGLGTFVSVQAVADSEDAAHAAVTAAFAAVARVDRLMHPTRHGSDLSALRSAAGGSAIRIDPWTYRVLLLSQQLYHASQHGFDPCLPDAQGSLSDLEFSAAGASSVAPTITVHAPVHIDLGGIAKGFAVDCALDTLRLAGCHAGMVNCGGDVAVFGDEPQRMACVGHAMNTLWVTLQNCALASSDTQSADRPAEHQGYYDGSNRSAITVGRAVVRAPTAALADGLTKCVLVLGSAADAVLQRFDAELILPPQ